jgi:outer membrane protein
MRSLNSLILASITIVALASTTSATSHAAADVKIAVVDLQRALQSVDAGKAAKSKLEKEFNEKKKTLQSEEESIKKMTEDFKKQASVLSDEAKNRKQNEIQERMIKYRELFSKSQFDIQNRERELTEPIIGKLKEIVQGLGTEKGYTIILEKNDNTVLYSLPKDDLTEEVIQSYNTKKKNG